MQPGGPYPVSVQVRQPCKSSAQGLLNNSKEAVWQLAVRHLARLVQDFEFNDEFFEYLFVESFSRSFREVLPSQKWIGKGRLML